VAEEPEECDEDEWEEPGEPAVGIELDEGDDLDDDANWPSPSASAAAASGTSSAGRVQAASGGAIGSGSSRRGAQAEQPQKKQKNKVRPEALMEEIRHLQAENHALRHELGHERFKVQQLGKLRDQASVSHKRELQARQNEAKAMRDLEEARKYVDKRNSFAQSEKAELLLKIKDLEAIVKEVQDREAGLKNELQDAIADTGRAVERAEQTDKVLEKWRTDAMDRSAKLKQAEQRLQQLEQKRSEDKAKIKALAEQLKLAVEGGVVSLEGLEVVPVKVAPSPEKVQASKVKDPPVAMKPPSAPAKPPSAGKRGGSRPPPPLAGSGGGTVSESAMVRRGFCLRRLRAAFARTGGASEASGVANAGSRAVARHGAGASGRRGAAAPRDCDILEEIEAENAKEYRQRQVLCGLVLLIVSLAAAKLQGRA